MISFDHVSTTHAGKLALDNLSFSVQPGEWLTILGKTGEDLSSIVRLMLRMEDPAAGTIDIDGVGLAALPAPLLQIYRSRVGTMFQSPTFLEHATVEENVGLPLELQGASPGKILKATAEMLQRTGLAKYAYDFPASLSQAEKVLAGVARALISTPNILLVEDPFIAIESGKRAMVLKLIQEQHTAGATVIVLTNDPQTAEQCGGRLLTLSQGKVIAEAAKAEPKAVVAAPLTAATPTKAQEESMEKTISKVLHKNLASSPSDARRKIKITAIHS